MNRRDFGRCAIQCGCFGLLAVGPLRDVLAQNKQSTGRGNKPGSRGPTKAPAEDGWEGFTHEQLGFSIRFPAAPQSRETANSIFYTYDTSGHRLLLIISNASRGITAWSQAAVQQLIQGSHKNNLNIFATKILSPDLLEYRAMQDTQQGQSELIGRIYLTRELEYELVVGTSPKTQIDPTLKQRFFQGFKKVPRTIAKGRQQQGTQRQPSVISCTTCNGTGVIRQTCSYCLGHGLTAPSFRDREGYWCRWCNGTGIGSQYRCSTCSGTGRVRL